MLDPTGSSDAIAVVGLAGRFPGAPTLDRFWTNLREGRETISFFTNEELQQSGVNPAHRADPRYVPAKGYLEDAELFDAGLFGLNPRQAEILDPQQRIFLEVAVEALENAGYDPRRCEESIGVFGGVSLNTYLLANLFRNDEILKLVGSPLAFTSNRTDHLTTRVAYALGLHGPAVTVQSACSTSLVAVHLACSSLLQRECDVVLAGGVTITVPRKAGYVFQEGGILSPDGHCRAFDARARGTLSGEGAGIVVLKRLSDAQAAGDTIHAVIKGSAINNDGSSKVGYTAPSVDGQAAVIAEALAISGVNPESVTYVEAHGTGTALGDPIEIEALTQVFRRGNARKGWCAIGSLKSNIGHLDAAAGVASLIKTILALRHRELPPSLHFEEPNPQIDFASSPFFVNTSLRKWESAGGPRRAGVSAFGFGGTNCHVVLEEAPERSSSAPSRDLQVVMLSARSVPALDAATARLASACRDRDDIKLADVAYTLAIGRKEHKLRRIVVCRDLTECADLLDRLNPNRVFSGEVNDDAARGAAFLFPGQGSQHTGMGQELYRTERVFRQALDECFEVIERKLGEDPRPILWDRERESQLRETKWAQCLLFSVEWSLTRLWRNWGVEPTSMIGHSIGEYVAACVAGVLDMKEMLSLVAHRGSLMQSVAPGSMLAVPLPEEQVRQALDRLDANGATIGLATVNAPSLCVVSGYADAVAELERQLSQEAEVECRRLHVSHAFHSPMMEPILEEFRAVVRASKLRAPSLRWVSNLTGQWITPREATDPEYWVRHLRSTVRFSDGLSQILQGSTEPLLEVGPGQVLRGLARWHPDKSSGRLVMSSFPAVNEGISEELQLRTTLGRLWAAGVPVDQARYFKEETRRRIPLPTYAFDHRKYWVDPPATAASVVNAGSAAARLEFPHWFYTPAWRRAPLPVSSTGALVNRQGGWLILPDSRGLARRLAVRLRERGEPVNVFSAGAHSTEALGRMLDELARREGLPSHIVHLSSLGTQNDPAQEHVLASGFLSLLHLSQALGNRRLDTQVKLLVVTSGVCDVTGNEPLSPEQATILGPCRSIPDENPKIACRSVDVMLPEDAHADASWDRLVDQLQAEALATDRQRAVAYRGTQRWVESFQPIDLPALDDLQAQARPGGVYLITGGLGGIGLEIAGLLAQTPGVKLVLIGRSSLPARDTWDRILAEGDAESRVCRQLRRVRELENKADLLLRTADVTDRGQMEAAVQTARARFGVIDGVVHAAGVPGGGIIQLKTDEAAREVLAPKVRGAQVLLSVLDGMQLEFLVLCSARGSLFGGVGQVDYCAGNAYLDALAASLARNPDVRAVSVNWPAWKEVGMLVDAVRGRQGRVGARNAGGESAGHPLLDRKLPTSTGTCEFFTRFDAATHWVLDEHRIVGSPVIPGTAYLEMAHAALQHFAAGKAIELRDVFFLKPVVVRDNQQRDVRVIIEKTDKGAEFRISCAPPGAKAEPSRWEDVCLGEARFFGSGNEPVHDISAWIARCQGKEVVQSAETPIRDDNGPRWRSLRRLYIGDHEILGRYEYPSEFLGELTQYGLHPALLDRVNLTAREYMADNPATKTFYLPFSYSRLTIRAPLPRAFWAYTRFRVAPGDERRETIAFDTLIVDEAGRELVSIVDFTQKRVTDPTEQIKALAGEVPQETEADQPAEEGGGVLERALAGGISPQEGTAALARILAAPGLAQIIVSPTDFAAELASRVPLDSRDETPAESQTSLLASDAHPRPDLSTPYREPRSDLERSLVETWQQMLHVQPIGIDDNFFELGGDSVQGVRLVNRYRELGLTVSQTLVFQNQTIAEVAAAIERESSQNVSAGALALTAWQRRVIADGNLQRAVIVRCHTSLLKASLLSTALDALRSRHQALSLKVTHSEGRWQQEMVKSTEPVLLILGRRSSDPMAENEDLVQVREQLTARLDPAGGVMFAAALLTGETDSACLLLAVSELVADPASISTLLEDLTLAYSQAAAGKVPAFSGRLIAYSDLLRSRANGLDATEPRLNGEGDLQIRASYPAENLSKVLTASDASALLHVANRQRVSVEELLLGSMTQVLSRQQSGQERVVELERSARLETFDDLELSRAVGPLGKSCKLVLATAEDAPDGLRRWRAIKSRIRPALLAAESRDVAEETSPPMVRMSYLGDLGLPVLDGTVAEITWEPDGAPPSEPRLQAFLMEGSLHMLWTYDPHRHAELVSSWAESVLEELRAAIFSTDAEKDEDLVSSDFPLANMDERSFERLTDLLQKLDTTAGSGQ